MGVLLTLRELIEVLLRFRSPLGSPSGAGRGGKETFRKGWRRDGRVAGMRGCRSCSPPPAATSAARGSGCILVFLLFVIVTLGVFPGNNDPALPPLLCCLLCAWVSVHAWEGHMHVGRNLLTQTRTHQKQHIWSSTNKDLG